MDWSLVFSESSLLAMIVKASLLLILTLMAVTFLKRSSASVRCFAISSVLILLPILPFLTFWSPAWEVPLPHAVSSHLVKITTPPPIQKTNSDAISIEPVLHPERPPVNPATRSSTVPVNILIYLWIGGTLVFSSRIGLGLIYNLKTYRHGNNNISKNIYNRIDQFLIKASHQIGLNRKVTIILSSTIGIPRTYGIIKPVIVVPRNLVPTLGSRHLRDVLFHELAHIRRHDLWLNLAQHVMQVVYFYNPFFWIAGAVIRRLRDEAADEVVLETIGDQDHSYARRLADVARLPIRHPASNLSLIGVA